LALNGGGIKGFYTIHILRSMIQKIRDNQPDKRFSEREFFKKFAVISGTSTGSILAAFIVTQLRYATFDPEKDKTEFPILDEAHSMYWDHSGDIFYVPWWPPARSVQNLPQYSTEKFEQLLKDKYVKNEAKELAGFREHKNIREPENWPFLHMNSYNCTTNQVAEFSDFHHSISHYDPRAKEIRQQSYVSSHSNALIYEAVLASSAAPTYFEPRKIKVEGHADSRNFYHNGGEHHFCDGGIYANNPSLAALSFAQTLYRHDTRVAGFDESEKSPRFSVLNVGTMFRSPDVCVGRGGYLTWLNPAQGIPLLNIMMEANSNFIRNSLKRLDGPHSSTDGEPDDRFDFFEIDNYNRNNIAMDAWQQKYLILMRKEAEARFFNTDDETYRDEAKAPLFLQVLSEYLDRNLKIQLL